MSAGNVTFVDAIRSYAKNNRIDLAPEHVGVLDSVLKSLGRIEGDQISFFMSEGKAGTFEQIMARETEGAPRIRAPKTEHIPVAAASSATSRAIEANKAKRATQAAAAASSAAADGNPWSPSTFSRTRQALIQNFNPELAATLRAQAGAKP